LSHGFAEEIVQIACRNLQADRTVPSSIKHLLSNKRSRDGSVWSRSAFKSDCDRGYPLIQRLVPPDPYYRPTGFQQPRICVVIACHVVDYFLPPKL
jgi:hypothetical protein